MYERLPRGPHRLGRPEVARHQRVRIHGAMVAAVAREGYAAVSVKRVTELAGVSRRSFYEQFRNKEECFLATFDGIVGRWTRIVARACERRRRGGSPEAPLRAACVALAGAMSDEPDAAALVLAHARTAGRPALARLRANAVACERRLRGGTAEARAGLALPLPIARALVGGALEIAASASAADRPSAELLAAALGDWALPLQSSPGPLLGERMAARAATLERATPLRLARGAGDARSQAGTRARLLDSALRLALLRDYERLTAPEIADGAGVPLEALFSRFRDRDECYAAALDAVAEALLTIVADAALDADDWPDAVRRALDGLFLHLAANPLHAHTIAHGALWAGERHGARASALVGALSERLTSGAPAQPSCSLAGEAIAGAIWHTVGCQAESGHLRALPLLADHMSFVVLAPYVGTDAAAAIALGDPTAGAVCG
jgi:AcrR family transcriptional regulator